MALPSRLLRAPGSGFAAGVPAAHRGTFPHLFPEVGNPARLYRPLVVLRHRYPRCLHGRVEQTQLRHWAGKTTSPAGLKSRNKRTSGKTLCAISAQQLDSSGRVMKGVDRRPALRGRPGAGMSRPICGRHGMVDCWGRHGMAGQGPDLLRRTQRGSQIDAEQRGRTRLGSTGGQCPLRGDWSRLCQRQRSALSLVDREK